MVIRWWRNRTGRPLSPPQIHREIICTLSKFYKTTSEHWWRTSGTQKGSPLSSKEVGQNIKDKKRDKRVRDGDPSWGGSHEGGEVSKHQENPLTVGSVVSFGISEGNITGRKKNTKTKTPQITHLTTTPSGEVAQTLVPTSSRG